MTRDGATDDMISHGICDECALALSTASQRSAGQFLESLGEPVFLAGAGGRIISGNSAARSIVGKELPAIEDQLAGNVFECANADLPGGCGKTKHCKACAIRISINETLESGAGVERKPAHQQIKTADGVREKRFLISTERVGEFVMLRIDDIA